MKAASPRIPQGDYFPHIPHPGPQQLFLTLDQHFEVFYGGAAGGGKSDALLMAALQYVDVPGYAALLLRRTFQDLTQPGALMDRLNGWLANTSAQPRGGGRIWEFPSGARIVFGYVMYHRDVDQYASAEYQFVGIDEISRGWERRTYEFLFSRVRTGEFLCRHCHTAVERSSWESEEFIHVRPSDRSDGRRRCQNFDRPGHYVDWELYPRSHDGLALPDVPLRVRTASNPGGSGHEWVKELFVSSDSRREDTVFVPAKLEDNPSLNRLAYERSLSHLGPVERHRLLDGDWDVVDEGNMFKAHWFDYIDAEGVPSDTAWCRYWDMSAMNPKRLRRGEDAPDSADWTVGGLLGLSPDGRWYLGDVARTKGTPFEIERFITHTFQQDEIRFAESGASWCSRMEQVSASGLAEVDRYRRQVFLNHDFDGDSPRGEKAKRAEGFSAAVEAGNFFLVKARWNEPFVDECLLFPMSKHDDQIDTVSGAMKILTERRAKRRRPARITTAAGRSIAGLGGRR